MVTFAPSAGDPLVLKSLVQQELLRRRILWQGFHNLSFSHTDADVDEALEAYRDVLAVLQGRDRAGGRGPPAAGRARRAGLPADRELRHPAGAGRGPGMSSFSLEGRVAVVTGALGLLGRHHCEALARAGATVVVTDLDPVGCVEGWPTVSRASHGRPAIGHAADIAVPASVRASPRLRPRPPGARRRAGQQRGRQREGRGPRHRRAARASRTTRSRCGSGRCASTSPAPSSAARRFGAEMARRRAGVSIINIASTYGIVAPDQSLYRKADGTQAFYKSAAYPTTKGAVLALTRYLAAYWGRGGVRVNALCPGGVENGQDAVLRRPATPSARRSGGWRDPYDYEGAIVFLASDASSLHDRREPGRRRRVDRVVSGLRLAACPGGARGPVRRAARRPRATRSRLVLTDCDGVLTDGGVYYSEHGEELKRFSLRDGMGVERLRDGGDRDGIVTGERSPIVARRAEKLRLPHLLRGRRSTRRRELRATSWPRAGLRPGARSPTSATTSTTSASWARSGREGLTAAPCDAVADGRGAPFTTSAGRGAGDGAFREFAEWILRLRSAGKRDPRRGGGRMRPSESVRIGDRVGRRRRAGVRHRRDRHQPQRLAGDRARS